MNIYFSVFLDYDFVVVVLGNIYNVSGFVYSLYEYFRDMVVDVEKCFVLICLVISMSKKEFKFFVGKYDFGRGQIMYIFEKVNLFYFKLGLYSFILFYVEVKQKFFYCGFDGQLEFVKNDD